MSESMWKLHKAKELADKMMFEASRARSLLDDALAEFQESDEELDKASQEAALDRFEGIAKGQSPNPPVRLRDCKVDDFVTSLQQKKALVRLLNREIVAMAKQDDGDE